MFLCCPLQVTEREHERMLSELSAKHDDELARLRESMEAAHQAELEQAQVGGPCARLSTYSVKAFQKVTDNVHKKKMCTVCLISSDYQADVKDNTFGGSSAL